MTHSLYFHISFGDRKNLTEFKREFANDDEFIETYQLKKERNDNYRMYGDQQPFIYFPDNDGEPYISIETGSHVAPEDKLYSLQWFYFTKAFIDRFGQELDELNATWDYLIEGDDTCLTDEQMLKEIMK